MDQNTPITNHKPWIFEPVEVNLSFLRGPVRWLMAEKKCIHQLGYELQNSHVFEMCSNFSVFIADWHSPWRGREICCCICERTLKGLQAHLWLWKREQKFYSYFKDSALILQQLKGCNILKYRYYLPMKVIPNGCLSCQKRFITG